MATLAHGFAGYARDLWPTLPHRAGVALFVIVLAFINLHGIRLASRANLVATTVELSGLLLVTLAGLAVVLGEGVPSADASMQVGRGSARGDGDVADFSMLGVLQGATVAFYAFIGFEDMVNVAEEVEQPRRHLPGAITVALLSVGVAYVIVNMLATAAVAPAELRRAAGPLNRVVAEGLPGFPRQAFAVIAVFAVGNTALLNFVMASRLTYGMAEEGLLPPWLGAVHENRRTPHRAVLLIGSLALALALSGTLETLAATTSLLLLTVFFVMNLGLVVVKRQDGPDPRAFSIPIVVPVLGMVVSAILAVFSPVQSVLTALGVVGAGSVALGLLAMRR